MMRAASAGGTVTGLIQDSGETIGILGPRQQIDVLQGEIAAGADADGSLERHDLDPVSGCQITQGPELGPGGQYSACFRSRRSLEHA